MKLSIQQLTAGFGAIIDHDLSRSATPEFAQSLNAALHRYRVLVFPDQHLNHADTLATASLFGTVDADVDRRYAVPGFLGITTISNIAEDGHRVGIYDGDHENEWHADNSFKQRLTSTTMLYSVIAPDVGGQTRFADATRAYDDLAEAVKTRISHLKGIHSIKQLGHRQAEAADGHSSTAQGAHAGLDEVVHPLAPIHPVTARRTLLIGSMVIRGIAGLSDEESSNLLTQLLDHATSAPYTYTHQWRQGDLVVWDNRAVLHTASPCDSTRHHRLLYRTAVH